MNPKDLIPGKRYRVTLEMEYTYTNDYGPVFYNQHGSQHVVTSEFDTFVEDVPWTILPGDIYRRGANVYAIDADSDVIVTGRVGAWDATEYNFREDELLYREP